MQSLGSRQRIAWGVVLALCLYGVLSLVLVRADIAQRREVFQSEARSAHRLLSQRMAQNEAILATLVLNARREVAGDRPLTLPTGFPHLLAARQTVLSLNPGQPSASGDLHIEDLDGVAGRYTLVLDDRGQQFRLFVDLRRLLDDAGWPWPARLVANEPLQVSLGLGDQRLVLQAGADPSAKPAGLTEGFRFVQSLGSPAQPFEFRAQQWTGPAEWPWGRLALAFVVGGLLLLATLRAVGQREERGRVAAAQRLAQVARLNTLGELAAGMAHELNQPLTAVLSGTQAALRLLKDVPPNERSDDVSQALPALELAAAQAKRAADVVSRLRASIKPHSVGSASTVIAVRALVDGLVHVLSPDLRKQGVSLTVRGGGSVRADRVALEQVMHNLLMNALQALQQADRPDRRIEVVIDTATGSGDRWVDCTVCDNGPGLPPDHLQRVFEPFFTTRADGLGLGLSLCQTLVQAMGGQLTAHSEPGRGARFQVRLPAASADAST